MVNLRGSNFLPMNSVLHDVRFSLRLIRKHPGMSLLVVAALVLGIGANSAMFSVVNAALLRPLPVSDPERLVFISGKSQQSSYMLNSYSDFQDWKAQARSFQNLAAALPLHLNITANGPPERMRSLGVTAAYFKTLGVKALIGRDFTGGDEQRGATRVAVLNYGIWQRRFGGDPNILGHTIKLNDEVYSIVGVLPPNPFLWIQTWDIWVGIGPFLDEHTMSRETRFLIVFGRLTHSVSLAQAQVDMETVAQRLAAQYPKSNKNLGLNVLSLSEETASAGKPLWSLILATSIILLLACVNVITVFIANATERRKELSTRLALGAARSAIWRQLFVQGLIFALLGASLGLIVAKLGVAYFTARFPEAISRFQETTLDQTVFWFTICLAVGTTLVSSIFPAIYTARLNISNELHGVPKGASLPRLRVIGQRSLIVVEVALAGGLSIISGLFIKSFYELQKVDLGFNPRHIISFQITLPETRYKDDAARLTFLRKAIENLKSIPGVHSVSASHTLPPATGAEFINLQLDAQSPFAAERPFVDSNSVLPGFFSTMKIPVIEGRDFSDTDRIGSSAVAIVDSVLAARMWPGQSAIGKRLRLADVTDNRPPWREVVGVVGQVRYFGPESKIDRLQVYEPAYQHPSSKLCFVMETTASPASLRPLVQKAIDDVSSDLPLDPFRPLDTYLDRIESGRKLSLLLLSGFAAVAIILGVIGIYGVVSNSVVQRRREIAIRMALGASVRSSIFLVTKPGLFSAITGIGFGAALVISLSKIFSAFLFGVTTFDQGIYFLGAGGILALSLVASLVPAAAIFAVHPQDVLRE